MEDDRREMRVLAEPRAQCASGEQNVTDEVTSATQPVEAFDLDRLNEAGQSLEGFDSSEIAPRITEDSVTILDRNSKRVTAHTEPARQAAPRSIAQSGQRPEELPTVAARNVDSSKFGRLTLEFQPIRIKDRAATIGARINETEDMHMVAVTCTADGAEGAACTDENGVVNSASPNTKVAENYLKALLSGASDSRVTAQPAAKTSALPSLPAAAAAWTDSTDEELGSGSSATAATAATGLSHSTADTPGSPGMGLPSDQWDSPPRASASAAPAEPQSSSLSIDSSDASSGAASFLRSGQCPISASNADAATAASTADDDVGVVAGSDATADAELKTDFSSMDPAALERLLNGPVDEAVQFWEQQVAMVDRLLCRTISDRLRVFNSEVRALDNAEALWQELQAFANRSDSNT